MHRILGTETEFGLLAKGSGQSDPVTDSMRLISHYPMLPSPQGIWDYENENPFFDARGFVVEGEPERPNIRHNRQLNKLLLNGGRLYVDGAHPEYSTPECSQPLELLTYERAGERIINTCLQALNSTQGTDTFFVYKNNSDGKGNSYGYHENYLLSRSVPFATIAQTLIPFFVTRQIYTGAGKVGAENSTDAVEYQISQRSDFFECVMDLNTMVKRPIINTRDEPHTEQDKYRRLHVIVGDANMAEIPTYLKIGTTAIIMEMLDAGWEIPKIVLQDPVRDIKTVSRDLAINASLRLANGRSTSSVDIQRMYLETAYEFYNTRDLSPATKDVLVSWERILDKLEHDPTQLGRELDWVAKQQMIQSFMDRKSCGWKDPRIALLDLQYHDMRPDKGLYYTLERGNRIDRLLQDADIEHALIEPPVNTRAYFRGTCLKQFSEKVYGVSWTSVLLDQGNDTIKRIPLMDPHRGTRALTNDLLEGVSTVDQLLAKLSE
ncbi:depupylase/deamidase Dop [Nitrospira sp. M1]